MIMLVTFHPNIFFLPTRKLTVYTGLMVDYFMSWPILPHSLFSLNKTNMSCSLSAIVNASKTDIYQWPPVFPQEWFIW